MLLPRLVGGGCVAVLAALLVPAPAAAVPPACKNPPRASPADPVTPWAQRLYSPREKIWPFSRGRGVTVAVVDAGVDAQHEQLQGKVSAGYDFVRGANAGNEDCVPHGTGIASVIVAKKVPRIGLEGLAPDARVLPVRVNDKAPDDPKTDQQPDPGRIAAAIDYAVRSNAKVIAVTAISYGFVDGRVVDAVSRALARGRVVIAPVGDGHEEKRDGHGPTDATGAEGLTPFPASLDGVIGVGAIAEDGSRVAQSQVGPYVDIVAPGGSVTGAAIGGHTRYTNTAMAAGFVSATAALLFASSSTLFPGLSGAALGRAVHDRILATASPSRGGRGSLAYGRGLLDPYRALTESIPPGGPASLRPLVPPRADPVAEAAGAKRGYDDTVAIAFAGFLVVICAALVVGAVLAPKGHRRRWRAGRATEALPEPDEGPEFLPGEALFLPTPEKNHSGSGRT